jgi:4-diphosphocytidyl-2-C-methyl-D-erythritol kinase
MPQMRIDAPAKLNLHLNVGKKRPDGFHEIQSLFLALAYGDTLFFEVNSEKPAFLTEIIIDWQLPWGSPNDLSPENNIINKAVSLFRERTGFDKRLKIVLEKRIPLGGGLGGGSSDAAAALLALNRLASPDMLVNDAVLLEMGASLGSDVPFFLQIALNKAPIAWVGGRGEYIQPLVAPAELQSLYFILVNSGLPSDTGKAFRLLDELRAADPQTLNPEPRTLNPILSDSPRDWPFTNDFLTVFEAGSRQAKLDNVSFSDCLDIISTLKKLGADFSGLSGSGSTCFGVFTSQDRAIVARESLLLRWNFVIETFLLAFKTIQCYNI